MRLLHTQRRQELLFLLVVLALVVPSFASPQSVLAYSCANPHCYGIVQWPGTVNGADTRIQVVPITYNNGDEFITNEMWLVDDRVTGQAWVEAGEETRQNILNGRTFYFWADKRPGSSFFRHPLGVVPTEDYGKPIFVSIMRSSSTSWHVDIFSFYQIFKGDSTGNSMVAYRIDIGEELYGTAGGSSPDVYWTDNRYRTDNLYYQPIPGNTRSPNPPVSHWDVLPQNSTTGGKWHARCC